MALHPGSQFGGEDKVLAGGDHEGRVMVNPLGEVGLELPVELASFVVVEPSLKPALFVLLDVVVQFLESGEKRGSNRSAARD